MAGRWVDGVADPFVTGRVALIEHATSRLLPFASGVKDQFEWDVFPIPSARAVFIGTGPNAQVTVVPGYFKMRSRFVDYTGQYVIHCHILAHEDRGMMTIVQVVPFTSAYSHK